MTTTTTNNKLMIRLKYILRAMIIKSVINYYTL